jgi:hypothetical protein
VNGISGVSVIGRRDRKDLAKYGDLSDEIGFVGERLTTP